MAKLRGAWWRPAGWPRWVRRTVTAFVAIVLLFALIVTAYRTLRPAETLSRATRPLPSPEPVKSIQYGELHSAPLIVEGRLRIFAEQRRVFADTPVTAVREMTPHWAFRRWPAEVTGVIVVDRTPLGGKSSIVVTKWSDGAIYALDAETGETVWQKKIDPVPDETYQGRRTGARTVYEPDGLYQTASAVDRRPIVVAAGKDVAEAYDPWTGTTRWSRTYLDHPGCRSLDWTGPTDYFVKDSCATPATLEVYDAGTGLKLNTWRPPGASNGPPKIANWFLEPASCSVGRSNCQLFKAAATGEAVSFTDAANGVGMLAPTYWRTAATGVIAVEPYADRDEVIAVGDILVKQVNNGYVWAFNRLTGQRLWMSEPAGQLLYADERVVYLVNGDYQLLVLSTATGAVTGSTELRIRPEDRWSYVQAYVKGNFVAVERLGTGKDSDVDERYYYSDTPVILVGA